MLARPAGYIFARRDARQRPNAAVCAAAHSRGTLGGGRVSSSSCSSSPIATAGQARGLVARDRDSRHRLGAREARAATVSADCTVRQRLPIAVAAIGAVLCVHRPRRRSRAAGRCVSRRLCLVPRGGARRARDDHDRTRDRGHLVCRAATSGRADRRDASGVCRSAHTRSRRSARALPVGGARCRRSIPHVRRAVRAKSGVPERAVLRRPRGRLSRRRGSCSGEALRRASLAQDHGDSAAIERRMRVIERRGTRRVRAHRELRGVRLDDVAHAGLVFDDLRRRLFRGRNGRRARPARGPRRARRADAASCPHSVGADHFHALAKLLLTFVLFWVYIGFSQFIVIWSAEIPVERAWYVAANARRLERPRGVLVAGHFALPFCRAARPRVQAQRSQWRGSAHGCC